MFENYTHLQFRPDTFEEGLIILRESIVPILRSQPGILSLALVPNRAASQVTVISIWVSRSVSFAVEAQAEYRRQVKKLDPLLHSQDVSAQPERFTPRQVVPILALN